MPGDNSDTFWELSHGSASGRGALVSASAAIPSARDAALRSCQGRTSQPAPTLAACCCSASRASRGSGGHVASDGTGQPCHPNLLTFRWSKLLDELGIKRVRLHDARHSCATLMHLRNVPIAVIAAWLGHASAAFTMSVYAHSQDDALKGAGTSFGRVVTICDTETGSEP